VGEIDRFPEQGVWGKKERRKNYRHREILDPSRNICLLSVKHVLNLFLLLCWVGYIVVFIKVLKT
jgi:hypothetical protein